MTEMLKEAKRLYALGFALLWLHEKSKRPLESGWTTGPRHTWKHLEESYIKELNMGGRLGTPAKIGTNYLAVIDVDIKSKDPRHRDEALAAVKKLVGEIKCPTVASGRGNGSCHLYCVTKAPFPTWNPAASDEIVKVHMPSRHPSKKELKELTAEEIKKGIRLSKAWEVSLYSDGRQVVLPPSIHPDSGKPYRWIRPLENEDDIPYIVFPESNVIVTASSKTKAAKGPKKALEGFEVEYVPLEWVNLSPEMYEAIKNGTGVDDRSKYLFLAASDLLKAGLNRNEILSVLTNKSLYLGKTAYEHRQTKDRNNAAQWLWDFTVKKVLEEKDPKVIFAKPVKKPKKLAPEEAAKQAQSIVSAGGWRDELLCGANGAISSSIKNVCLILQNSTAPDILRRNEFAYRDTFSRDTPWGSKAGAMLIDDDIAKMKCWMGENFRFEPPKPLIEDALTVLACKYSYDPVKEWLETLEWDGVKRLGTWLADFFGADGNAHYLSQVFRKWMVAMVGRVYRPGLKFDWMPIFEAQLGGEGKSSFGKILAGEQFFLDWLPKLDDKDAALGLQGHWVVEMAELSSFYRSVLEAVKAFITRTVDKFRPPHGRKLIESPRRCVFFGTTNKDKYLSDDGGLRRFKPVKVRLLNFRQLEKDRVQLFAEAVSLFKNNFTNSLDFDLTGRAREFELEMHQEKRVEDDSDAMALQFEEFLRKVQNGEASFDHQKFNLVSLFSGTGPLSTCPFNGRSKQFASKMLKKFGGENRKVDGLKFWKIDPKWIERDRSEAYHIPEDFY